MFTFYPTELPGPAPSQWQPAARNRASSLDGPEQVRPRQRDGSGAQRSLTWIYTPDEMSVWEGWFNSDLKSGRRWFAVELPGSGGLQMHAARYLSVQQSLLGGGLYRVNAVLELRGSSKLPLRQFTEDFDEALAPYSYISGNLSIFKLGGIGDGNAIFIESQISSVESVIQRDMPGAIYGARHISAKFQVGPLEDDDGCWLKILNSGSPVLSFSPVREHTYDSLRRPHLSLGTGLIPMASTSVNVRVVYQLDVTISDTAGGTTASITRASDGFVHGSVSLPGLIAPLTINGIQFWSDSGSKTVQTWYDHIHMSI